MRSGLMLLVVGLALAGRPAAAQQGELGGALLGVEDGALLRVQTRAGDRLVGSYAGFESGAIVLSSGTGVRAIAGAEVARVWERRSSAGRGALIGAGAGLVAGAVFGYVIGSVACEPVDGGDCSRAVVTGVVALGGAAAGAGAGAIIGHLIPRWAVRF